jgi:hypothetical protein
VPVYSPIVTFGDGSTLFFRARERPHMILDEARKTPFVEPFHNENDHLTKTGSGQT